MIEQVGATFGVRVARGLAVAALTVPAMVVAHLLTAGTAPSPAALVGVAVLVAAVGACCVDGGARPAGPTLRGAQLAMVGLAQLAGHAVFSAATSSGGGCLPVMGRGAELGLRLALLQSAPACPPGTVGLTGAAATATSVLLAAALLLLAHAATGLGGLNLLRSAENAWWTAGHALLTAARAVGSAMRLGAPMLPVGAPWSTRRRSGRDPERRCRALVVQWFGEVGRRRGPPLAAGGRPIQAF